jgi:PKD repeat protein
MALPRAARIATVMIVLAALVGAGWGSGVGSALPVFSSGSTVGTGAGASELLAAEHSLAHAQGPVATGAVCHSSGSEQVRCSVLAPAVGPTAYAWNNITAAVGPAPSPRGQLMMTYDVSDGYVLLYGGYNGFVISSDTWSFANGTWTNLTASTTGRPPPTVLGSLAYDPSTGKVILFGGENFTGSISETWSYHAGVWTNLTGSAGTPPSARYTASMVTDSTDRELVLVGGFVTGPVGALAHDTWVFKDGTWTNVSATAPITVALELPTLADDPPDGGVLLTTVASNFSAFTTPFYAVTFLYHGGVWENRTTFGPSAPPATVDTYAAMVYLPSLSAVLLVAAFEFTSGGVGVGSTVTWAYTGGSWSNITTRVTTGLGMRTEFALAADLTDSTVVLFGGAVGSNLVNSTWVLSTPPTVSASASPAVTDVGVPVSFTGTIAFGVGTNHPVWNFGDGHGAFALSSSHAYSTAGAYRATLTATDLVGLNASTMVTVTVNPTLAVAATVVPGSPTAGAAVGLFATVTGGTGPYSFAWSLGDGGSATTAAVNHTYASAGTYQVSLKVTDAVGQVAFSNESVVAGTASSAGSSFSYTSGMGLTLLLVIVVLLIVAGVLGAMLARKGRGPSGPPTPYAAPPSGGIPPGAGGGPPPGANPPPPSP